MCEIEGLPLSVDSRRILLGKLDNRLDRRPGKLNHSDTTKQHTTHVRGVICYIQSRDRTQKTPDMIGLFNK